MMTLSLRARESIKTGLAMVVTIAIALWMDFLEPQWAGFAVAMISLDSAGQSLNKASMRMVGTLAAFVASLTFMGLFPQQRWEMLLLALTPYIGFCSYMIAGNQRQYAWYVAAFVCMTIMVHAGVDSIDMFRYAVARVEETALGIAVYTLFSVFLWPRGSRADLEDLRRKVLEAQLGLYRAYRDLLAGRGRPEDSRSLRLEAHEYGTGLDQLLPGAEKDTYAVWEVRHAWRRFSKESRAFLVALARWRVSLPEVQPLDLARLLPGMETLLADVEDRFAQIGRMLAGEEPDRSPRTVELAPTPSEVQTLGHFERASMALFVTQLRKIDEASRALFDAVRDIEGSGRVGSAPLAAAERPAALAFDVDRFRSAVNVVVTMWTGFLIWVWVDPPGHDNFWYQAALWSMAALLARRPVASMLPGFLWGIAVAGVVYVLVMPHLSGYAELGLMLFCVTTGLFYAFWNRRLDRSQAIALFLILTSIGNEQTYSFSQYANSSAATLLSLALACAMSYFPSSPRPEKIFLRLLTRYFRRAEILMSRLAPDRGRGKGLLARWRTAWVRGDLLDIAPKLAGLMNRIDYRLLPGTTHEQVRELVWSLNDLALRIEDLSEARERMQLDPRLERVLAELREWRLAAEERFRLWSGDPAVTLDSVADIGQRLHARLARMEAAIAEAREEAGEEGFRVDYETLYRYLGGFRGMSEAGMGYADVAAAVDWEPWREARF